MNWVFTLLLSLTCAVSISSSSQEKTFTIDALKYHEDTTKKLSFEDILSATDSLLISNPNYQPSLYHSSSAYWIKLDFCIKHDEEQYLMEFYDQTIDSISLFVSKNGLEFKKYQFGSSYNFDDKPFQHKNFEVFLGGEGNYVAYARIVSRNYVDIRVAVRSINRFINYALNEYYLYGLFYGMILIISLYNVSIYSAISEVKYLYYTFYILSVGLFAMCVDGIAYQYLWPSMPRWNHIAHGVALFSVIFWSVVFSKRFLNLKVRVPKINRLLNWVLVLRSGVFLYALLIDQSIFNYRNIEILPLSIVFIAGIYTLKKGYKPARFFVLAYGFLFLGFLIKSMLMLSILPFRIGNYSQYLQILSYYSLHICFLLEMLFLSIALSDRIRILKDNRDRVLKRAIKQHEENASLKDKVNRELEQKIKERTIEIEERNRELALTNQQLYEQTETINKINSKLDLDNWKLKNNLKEVLQDQLINKNLTYGQFKEIFPDELSCLHFLDKLKWSSGYVCIKCSNKRHSPGRDKFSKRCSRCGYDESLTSNTIFHRVKFPLQKAFYILYVMTHNGDEYTLDELSNILDLRRNTIWNFRKKIREKYQDEGAKFQVKNIFNLHLNS